MLTIKVRSNSSRQSHGPPYRAECVRERQESGYELWPNDHNYGSLWVIEGYFLL